MGWIGVDRSKELKITGGKRFRKLKVEKLKQK